MVSGEAEVRAAAAAAAVGAAVAMRSRLVEARRGL